MTRQQRKDSVVQDVRRYSEALAVACEQVEMEYKGVPYTPRGKKDWEAYEPNALGKQIPDAGRLAFPAQARANGRPL